MSGVGCVSPRMDGKSFACVWDRLHPNPYMVVVVSASVLGPTAVISFCYIQIYRRVTQSRDTVSRLSRGRGTWNKSICSVVSRHLRSQKGYRTRHHGVLCLSQSVFLISQSGKGGEQDDGQGPRQFGETGKDPLHHLLRVRGLLVAIPVDSGASTQRN